VSSKSELLQWIEEHGDDFTVMADRIWETPELAFREFKSSKLQADYLASQGFSNTWNIGEISTAFVAEAGAGAPIIGILGEYDALPGLSQARSEEPEPIAEGGPGHGCGHNLLGTAGVAAAVALKQWLADTSTPGTIRYYGCPAEEQITGKTFMARDGVFDDLDAALNFHPDRLNHPSKGRAVGVYDLKFRFHGRTAHAGGAPHEGRSALDAVELMNVGVNYLREHVREKVRIHYVITEGGRAPNIVPDEAEVWYFIRAENRSELDEVAERVSKIADGAAMMTDTRVERVFRGACSSVLNNHYLADLQFENMNVVGPITFTDEEREYAAGVNRHFPSANTTGLFDRLEVPEDQAERVRALDGEPLIGENFPAWDRRMVNTGSTDVGDVSWITPLSMLRTACYATGAASHSWGVVATVGMSIGHKGMLHAAKVMAATGFDLFSEERHLGAAQSEHRQRTRGEAYVSPIPADVMPPHYPNPRS
jgi:aminobenzoyl-glutamate utilization protein B